MSRNNLTQDRLKSIVNYDKDTGVFTKVLKTDSRGRKWGGHVMGYEVIHNGKKYKMMSVDRYQYLLHRLAWLYIYGNFPPYEIDHIDGDGLNNSIENLRESTRAGNNQNLIKAQSNNKLGLLGAFLHKETGKYRSRIMVNRKIIELGLFRTPEEAHIAYINAKRKYHLTCTI